MLVLEHTLLSEYLDGTDTARVFLEQYKNEEWAVSAIGLCEAYIGCTHGYIDGSPDTIRQAVTMSMNVLE